MAEHTIRTSGLVVSARDRTSREVLDTGEDEELVTG